MVCLKDLVCFQLSFFEELNSVRFQEQASELAMLLANSNHITTKVWDQITQVIMQFLFLPNLCVCVCVCVPARVCMHAQSCLNLCDSMNCSPPGCSVHGTLQARVLEWVAISFSRGLPIQGLNLRFMQNLAFFLHWQVGSLPAELLGKPL